MKSGDIFSEIIRKRSFLCVGLDSDMGKIPKCLSGSDDPQFEFNKAIIDATCGYAICYKPNVAFYEENGAKGWESFFKTCRYIKENHPEILVIADAKRGDIGNTSAAYARAFFDSGFVDAVTVSPYMGRDSVEPFLYCDGKWAVILALTSNAGSEDFEMQTLQNGRRLYEQVLVTSSQWGSPENTMYVVGATRASMLDTIRDIVPEHFILVPGIGAQGGSLHEVASYGMNKKCGLIVNLSRSIIFADGSGNFAETASAKAHEVQQEMDSLLATYL